MIVIVYHRLYLMIFALMSGSIQMDLILLIAYEHCSFSPMVDAVGQPVEVHRELSLLNDAFVFVMVSNVFLILWIWMNIVVHYQQYVLQLLIGLV